MTQYVTPHALKKMLSDGREIALLDTREHGLYGEGHPFYATHLPYSRLEIDAPKLMPNPAVRIVLYGQDNELANRAAMKLKSSGYQNVSILEGGLDAWVESEYTLFKGVHVPSKAFGEIVEHRYQTPHITVDELKKWQDDKASFVLLDGRTTGEFRKMSIPGAVCCPNAELPYRIHTFVSDETTPIVINCAGRTRSIIGAQSLINMGIKNPVYALENGTQGWYLNDYALNTGEKARYGDVGEHDSTLSPVREAAKELISQNRVVYLSADEARRFLHDADRTTYVFDIRTPEEYLASGVPGMSHAEGGQLVQGTDLYAGVRNSRVVLYDTDGVRAPLVASWLSQLGYETYLLKAEDAERALAGQQAKPVIGPGLQEVSAERVKQLVDAGSTQILDLRPSQDYRNAHIEGASWSTRSRIARDVNPGVSTIVLIASDPAVAALAASELPHNRSSVVLLNRSDTKQWQNAGLNVVATPDNPPDADCIDFLFFVHDRHDGNKQAARQYLAWETNLINQMDDQEKATYRFPF